ncbi:MAG: InlB B-repeat-containing protein [Povalibacter sp.]
MLTANETDDFVVNWSGACSGAGSACYVYLYSQNSDATVTATFVPKHLLTVTKTGDTDGRVYSSPPGIDCGSTCSYRFGQNSYVYLSVDSYAYDVTWSGACTGTNTFCYVQMSAAASVNAQLAQRQTLTLTKTGLADGLVTSIPSGIYCDSFCNSSSTQFPRDTVVTLTASSASGYSVQWSGACTGTSSVCVVTMDKARSVAARFASLIELQVQTEGQGAVRSDPAGIDCGATCRSSFFPGTAVTLVATANEGSTFTGWTGGCTGTASTCAIQMDQARFAKATFTSIAVPVPPRTAGVSVTVTGSGTVTSDPAGVNCGTACVATYNLNSKVTLTAHPASDSMFAGWSNACQGAALTCVITMTDGQSVTARFVVRPLLTVAVIGSGTVTSSPAGIDCGTQCITAYDPNALVTLTAQALAGSEFTQWSDSCSGSSGICQVSMDQAKKVTASFRTIPPPSTGGGNKGGGGGGGGGSMAWTSLAALLALLAMRQDSQNRIRFIARRSRRNFEARSPRGKLHGD